MKVSERMLQRKHTVMHYDGNRKTPEFGSKTPNNQDKTPGIALKTPNVSMKAPDF